jgi:tetratricopeptide (TPR) repeat protein
MRIFISSPLDGLQPFRAEIALQCSGLSVELTMMEAFDAGAHPPEQYCADLMRGHDLFILVLRARLGSYPPGGTRTYTQLEYEAAHEAGIEVLVFLADPHTVTAAELDGSEWMLLLEWKKDLAGRHTTKDFHSVHDLGLLVRQAIQTRLVLHPPAPIQHTYPRPPQPCFVPKYIIANPFYGRTAERAKLTEWWEGETSPGMVITAIGGMGKSYVAWTWLHDDVLRRGDVEGVIWFSFYETDATFQKFLKHAAAYLTGVAVADLPPQTDVWEVVLRAFEARRLLFVLDGFERELRGFARSDIARLADDQLDSADVIRQCVDPVVGRRLLQLVQGHPRGRVLVTSRVVPYEIARHPNVPQPGWATLSLVGLDAEGVHDYFRAAGIAASPAAVADLAARVGSHPLSLSLFVGLLVSDPLIRGDFRHADELLREIRTHREGQTKVLAEVGVRLPREQRHFLCRLSTFRGSISRKDLIELYQIASPGGQEADLRRIVVGLIERNLLHFSGDRFDLHPVVRSYFYDLLGSDDARRTHAELAAHYERHRKEDRVRQRGDLSPLIEWFHHLAAAGETKRAFELFSERRIHHHLYHDFGAYREAIALVRSLSKDDLTARERSRLHVYVGNYWGRLADYPAARAELDAAAAIFQSLGEHEEYARNLGDIANLDIAEGRIADAYERLAEADATLTTTFWLCVNLTYRATVESLMGEYSAALALLEKAQRHWEDERMTRSVAVGLSHMAAVHLLRGDPATALRFVQEAFHIPRRRAYVVDEFSLHNIRARCRMQLGHVAAASADIDRAGELCLVGSLHELEAALWLTRAQQHAYERSIDEALHLARQGLEIARQNGQLLEAADATLAIAMWTRDPAGARAAMDLASCGVDVERSRFYYKPTYDAARALLNAS